MIALAGLAGLCFWIKVIFDDGWTPVLTLIVFTASFGLYFFIAVKLINSESSGKEGKE